MCECGCSNQPINRIFKINGNKYIVIRKYPGCRDCIAGIGIMIDFYDKNGFLEWCKDENIDVEEIVFNEWGGTIKGIELINQRDLLAISGNYNDILSGGFDNMEEVFEEYGYQILEEAIIKNNNYEKI